MRSCEIAILIAAALGSVSAWHSSAPSLAVARPLRRAARGAPRMVVVNEDKPIFDLADPEKGFKKVFVAGGTSGVGKLCVEKLLAAGKEVVALARSDEGAATLEAMGPGVTVARGDATNIDTIEPAIDGCDACITTLGGKGEDGKRVDYVGSRNVIEAAGIYGVSRIVLVTSIGCGDSRGALSDATFEVLREALEEKDKVEKMLARYYTNSLWTIIRPGGLLNDAPSGAAALTEDTSVLGSVSRADVADLVVRQLDSEATFKKTLSCLDPTRADDPPVFTPFEF